VFRFLREITEVANARVIIVHLRRPTGAQSEMRSDPFWEFGSFGITGCHSKNLMNDKKADKLNGARLAFAQGGRQGTRLVYVTPPVRIVKHRDHRIEALWTPHPMPFRYDSAPVLASNTGPSHFPQLAASIKAGRRTKEGQFASCFRSRTGCIADGLARELVRVYEEKRKVAQRSDIARSYKDALPWDPPQVDPDRERTYTRFLSEASGSRWRSRRDSRRCLGPRPRTRRHDRSCSPLKS